VVMHRTTRETFIAGSLPKSGVVTIRSALVRKAQKKRASRTSGWRATIKCRSCATRRTPYAGFNRIRFQGTFSAAIFIAAPLAAVPEWIPESSCRRQPTQGLQFTDHRQLSALTDVRKTDDRQFTANAMRRRCSVFLTSVRAVSGRSAVNYIPFGRAGSGASRGRNSCTSQTIDASSVLRRGQ
jgi:hypothetical protein